MQPCAAPTGLQTLLTRRWPSCKRGNKRERSTKKGRPLFESVSAVAVACRCWRCYTLSTCGGVIIACVSGNSVIDMSSRRLVITFCCILLVILLENNFAYGQNTSSGPGPCRIETLENASKPSFLNDTTLTLFHLWVDDHLYYPEDQPDAIGRLFVDFDVLPDGSISNVVVTRGLCASVDSMCKKVLRSSPKWKPSELHGEKCTSRIKGFVIIFMLR